MGTYTPTRYTIPTGLDEAGIKLSMQRLPGETTGEFKRRLMLELRDRSGPTQAQFIRSVGRKVGQFDTAVFDIDLLVDGNNDDLAADPYIEVTSTYLRAYYDWTNNGLDFELNLVDRNDGYFLRDVYNAFVASTYFSITVLDSNYTYLLSRNLRFDKSDRFIRTEYLYRSRSNRLDHERIREIYPSTFQYFETEVATPAEVDDEGKFYVDYRNGVVFTYDPASNTIAYTYRDFPFRLWYAPCRAWPYRDADKVYRTHDMLISDTTGAEAPLLLNSEGAELANEVLDVHPLGWGE